MTDTLKIVEPVKRLSNSDTKSEQPKNNLIKMTINQEKSLVDIGRIKDFYEDYFQKAQTSCGWSSLESATESYIAASDCSKQDWKTIKSVLDVGSGEGHFSSYLRTKRQFKGKYTGLELLPKSHETALKLYEQDPLSEFICDEFLGYDFGNQKFDWVISLGALSVKQEQQKEHDKTIIKKMIGLANYGISIYINDVQKLDEDDLDVLPYLATHNLSDFINLLEREFNPKELTCYHFPHQESLKTMIHLTIK